MTQNACPANAKVSERNSSFGIPLPHLLCSGWTKWTVMGGSLNLLEDLMEVFLVEFGGSRMGSRAIPNLWHYNFQETSRERVRFFWLV